jgi:hypothetical protein
MAVVYGPRRTNHALHLVLTAVTCGMWAPVWFGVWLYNKASHDKYYTRGL